MTQTVLAALTLFTASATSATSPLDADRWQAMARVDLDAMRARILEGHPGVIDPANPEFKLWVEQGYEQAKTYLPYIVSYDTAKLVVRYYAAGFEDGHLVYSDDIRENFPIFVNGWHVKWEGGHYVVAAVLPNWSVPLPPVSATWIACDGLSAEQVMQTRIAPFSDLRTGEQSRNHRVGLLWMQLPVAENLRECTFQKTNGDTIRLPVNYQPIYTEQFFDTVSQLRKPGTPSANSFELNDGILWVRAGNFHLNKDDQQALATMLAELAKLHYIRAIVFDSRGNRGGDSSIGDHIFEAATGGLEFDQTDLDSLPRYYAQWRVSDYLIQFLGLNIEENKKLYGADSPRVADDIAFRDKVVTAKTAGQIWVEQDAGHMITREAVVARCGHLRRFNAKVALLTDSNCVSACLDFADIVLRVPGVVHVGETTGADSVYLVGSSSEMPSGNRFVMPVKVWRNRTRGNNQALVPEVAVNLDSEEATIRRDVRRALGLE
ncbi:MAG: S41 family peptidase [Arenimonas sp.]